MTNLKIYKAKMRGLHPAIIKKMIRDEKRARAKRRSEEI